MSASVYGFSLRTVICRKENYVLRYTRNALFPELFSQSFNRSHPAFAVVNRCEQDSSALPHCCLLLRITLIQLSKGLYQLPLAQGTNTKINYLLPLARTLCQDALDLIGSTLF